MPRRGLVGAASSLSTGNPRLATKLVVLVVGNCQVGTVGRCVEAMLPHATVHAVMVSSDTGKPVANTGPIPREVDAVIAYSTARKALSLTGLIDTARITYVPRVTFAAYHPDIVYVPHDGGMIPSPMGEYHSAIILRAWLEGLTVPRTLSLFSEGVYDALGYFAYWESSARNLLEEGRQVGVTLDDCLRSWSAKGCFMFTVNHPRLHALADVARAALRALELEPSVHHPELLLSDPLMVGPVWPVFARLLSSLISRLHRFQCPKCYDPLLRAPSTRTRNPSSFDSATISSKMSP